MDERQTASAGSPYAVYPDCFRPECVNCKSCRLRGSCSNYGKYQEFCCITTPCQVYYWPSPPTICTPNYPLVRYSWICDSFVKP